MTNKYYSHHLLLLCFIVAFCLQSASAQPYQTNPDYKRTFVWYFAQSTGLDFKTNPPTTLTNGAINAIEGISSISDTAGNLLLYSDGYKVWNKYHQVIKNGTGLLGNWSSTQAVIILHHPANDSLFYIVTTPNSGNHNIGMNYSVVNIKAANDSGEVILKNTMLYPNSTEKLAAVNHQNGRDIWVVGHTYGSNAYYAFLLTENGFQKCPVMSYTGFNNNISIGDSQAEIKFSADGSLLAACWDISGRLDILSFNKESGEISFTKALHGRAFGGGGI